MSDNNNQAKPAKKKDAGKIIRNIVWITFAAAFVLVNLIAEVGYRFTGIEIHMFLRIAFILALTMGISILGAVAVLVTNLGNEKPLSGHARDTLGADRKKS